jgi:endogenous inhibitor of DNA gyrase (YacG/DUF329 family)
MPARCPTCEKPLPPQRDAAAAQVAPFCSERCKMADLGRWLRGEYAVPARADDDGDGASPPDMPSEE